MTTHDATSWNVHRDTLKEHAHTVDGVTYIGGRGVRLDGLLESTYVEEAHQLGNDLAECLAALPPALAQQVLDGMKGALGDAAEHRHPARTVFVTGEQPVLEPELRHSSTIPADPWPDRELVAEPVEAEPEQPRRRRGRGKDDAVAALDAERGPETGEVAPVVG